MAVSKHYYLWWPTGTETRSGSHFPGTAILFMQVSQITPKKLILSPSCKACWENIRNTFPLVGQPANFTLAPKMAFATNTQVRYKMAATQPHPLTVKHPCWPQLKNWTGILHLHHRCIITLRSVHTITTSLDPPSWHNRWNDPQQQGDCPLKH